MIKSITNTQEKQAITKAILEDNKAFFGIDAANKMYINAVKNQTFYAFFHEDEALGFISLKHHYSSSIEIYVMAVKKRYHHQGIGKLLVNKAMSEAKVAAIDFIQVKTLDDTHPDEGYKRTREFYESLGFKPLERFPTLWDDDNPCLLYVKGL